MNISKTWRLGGFVAALGASAALVASASGATGAYFTDSHDGSISATSGHLAISMNSSTTLDFSKLVPGVYKTQDISYSTSGDANEDVWLVFDDTDGYEAWTGPKSNSVGGGLGRYGHFAVANNNDLAFQSYNLQNVSATGGDECAVDGNGRGGSAQQASSPTDTPPLCGVPQDILLASNLAPGATGEIELAFGVTGKWTSQGAPVASVPFHIVATQTGIRPDALNY